MPCIAPLTAYWSKEFGKSGKRGITFSRGASFSGIPFKLPCLGCVECRADGARDWATRLMHERKCHDEAWFLTLTFDPEHLPEDRSLSKRDVQLFMHKFRKSQKRKFGRKIRFFACGEYGDDKGRPHYHLIVFNVHVPDRKFYKKNERGETLWSSKYLDEVWSFGMTTVGDVTYDSAAYCARYAMKKITGKMAEEFYIRYSPDGVINALLPEFSLKSNRPGIGREFFDKYWREFYVSDSCIMNGKEVPVPKYYDGLLEKLDAALFARIKLRRRKRGLLRKADNSVDRRRAREVIALKRLSMQKRGVA